MFNSIMHKLLNAIRGKRIDPAAIPRELLPEMKPEDRVRLREHLAARRRPPTPESKRISVKVHDGPHHRKMGKHAKSKRRVAWGNAPQTILRYAARYARSMQLSEADMDILRNCGWRLHSLYTHGRPPKSHTNNLGRRS